MGEYSRGHIENTIKYYGNKSGRMAAGLASFKGPKRGEAQKRLEKEHSVNYGNYEFVSNKENNKNAPSEKRARDIFMKASNKAFDQASLKQENGSTMARRQALEAEARKRK